MFDPADDRVVAELDAEDTAADLLANHDLGAHSWTLVDLDADGGDEILRIRNHLNVGVTSSELWVLRMDGNRLIRAGTLALSYDNAGAKAIRAPKIVRCKATHQLVDGPSGQRAILITADPTEAGRLAEHEARRMCPLEGPHRYGLIGGELRELVP